MDEIIAAIIQQQLQPTQIEVDEMRPPAGKQYGMSVEAMGQGGKDYTAVGAGTKDQTQELLDIWDMIRGFNKGPPG